MILHRLLNIMKKTLMCPILKQSCQFFFVISLIMVAHFSEAATVCTMTFSSSDEKETLQQIYAPQGVEFIELVPPQREDRWLENACHSQVQCDILLISGHFGGLFFGEASGLSVSLPELERASCRNDCRGIFKRPKDVFLFGCNTLAGKKKDHRSFDQYVEVLVRDGFDRELAESVAISRYQQLGLSMAERFQSVFPEAERIHGYSSTGPLGAQVAPSLKRSFKQYPAKKLFSEGAPLQKLKQELAGISYHVVSGVQTSADVDDHRMLSCQADHLDGRHFEMITDPVFFKKHYESVLKSASEKILFNTNFRSWLEKNTQAQVRFRQNLMSLYNESPSRLGLRLQIIDVQMKLDLLTSEEVISAKARSLQEQLQLSLKDGLNYQEAEQICSQRLRLRNIPLPMLPPKHSNSTLAYWQRIQECLTLESPVSESPGDQLLKLSSHSLKSCLLGVQQQRQRSYQERDGSRWNCVNRYETQMQNLDECLVVYEQFEDKAGSGFAWTCLKSFPQQLNIKACLRVAKSNADISNADDMIWNCWSKMQHRSDLRRSECLALSVGMQIYGNRLKMNWNCQNRVSKD